MSPTTTMLTPTGAPTPPSAPPSEEVVVRRVLFAMPWRLMSQLLLALPVLGMFVCLITSLIMHSDHINNTICKVYNFLPSISAVTGVSPQRYLWRVAVALHISPRLLVAMVARAYYNTLAAHVPPARRPAFLSLVTASFYLNLTELATLCGVTYISNKENYPVHEKLFTLFMLVSLVYMLCVIRVLRAVRDHLTPRLVTSFKTKKWLFGIKLASTGGLLFFFWRHRVYCQPMAFSWFSLCEYIIATCNMLYHVSVALDFSDEHLIVGTIATSPSSSSSSSSSANSSLHPSASTNSIVSYCHSCSTSESMATCEGGGGLAGGGTGGGLVAGGGGGLAVTRNGRVEEVEACEGGMEEAERGEESESEGCGGIGGRGREGGGGGGRDGEEEAPPVVHQVLNTIHESAEPSTPTPTLVHRRPPPTPAPSLDLPMPSPPMPATPTPSPAIPTPPTPSPPTPVTQATAEAAQATPALDGGPSHAHSD